MDILIKSMNISYKSFIRHDMTYVRYALINFIEINITDREIKMLMYRF